MQKATIWNSNERILNEMTGEFQLEFRKPTCQILAQDNIPQKKALST